MLLAQALMELRYCITSLSAQSCFWPLLPTDVDPWSSLREIEISWKSHNPCRFFVLFFSSGEMWTPNPWKYWTIQITNVQRSRGDHLDEKFLLSDWTTFQTKFLGWGQLIRIGVLTGICSQQNDDMREIYLWCSVANLTTFNFLWTHSWCRGKALEQDVSSNPHSFS